MFLPNPVLAVVVAVLPKENPVVAAGCEVAGVDRPREKPVVLAAVEVGFKPKLKPEAVVAVGAPVEEITRMRQRLLQREKSLYI